VQNLANVKHNQAPRDCDPNTGRIQDQKACHYNHHAKVYSQTEDEIYDYTPAVRQGSRVKVAKQRHRGISNDMNSQSQHLFESHLQNCHRMEGLFEPNHYSDCTPCERKGHGMKNFPNRFESAFMASVVDITLRTGNQGILSPERNIADPGEKVIAILRDIPRVPFLSPRHRLRGSEHYCSYSSHRQYRNDSFLLMDPSIQDPQSDLAAPQ